MHMQAPHFSDITTVNMTRYSLRVADPIVE